MRFLALAILFLGFAAGTATAAPIAGQDAPRYRAALELWLDDDEAGALPELADLATEGNRAAQVLLALIDRTTAAQGPWLVARERAERLALMRAPGGMSGRSWLSEAAADTPLAQLWLERDSVAASPRTALAFAAMGEARAARETLQAVAARLFGGFAEVADEPLYPADLRHLVWQEWSETPEGAARAEVEIAALPPGDPQILRFSDREVAPADFDAWLASAPLAAPLRASCETLCPESPASCRRAGYLLVGGHVQLAEFGTPSETLIPTQAWLASPRGRLALLRVPAARFRFGYETWAAVGAEDACLADALAGEVARFHR
jgi:hypothetical protein